jgi:hypothetical protein
MKIPRGALVLKYQTILTAQYSDWSVCLCQIFRCDKVFFSFFHFGLLAPKRFWSVNLL